MSTPRLLEYLDTNQCVPDSAPLGPDVTFGHLRELFRAYEAQQIQRDESLARSRALTAALRQYIETPHVVTYAPPHALSGYCQTCADQYTIAMNALDGPISGSVHVRMAEDVKAGRFVRVLVEPCKLHGLAVCDECDVLYCPKCGGSSWGGGTDARPQPWCNGCGLDQPGWTTPERSPT